VSIIDYYGQYVEMAAIKYEKDKRRHEILVLERKKKILDIRENQINHDLEQLEGIRLEISAREAEAEPLLSLAR